MKLNNSNFDQTSFSHKRAIMTLLWLRSKQYVPDTLKVSFRDTLFVYLGHYHSQAIPKAKSLAQRIAIKLQGKNKD